MDEKKLNELLEDIRDRLHAADHGRHQVGNLILSIQQLTEIIELQNTEINQLKASVSGITYREGMRMPY